MVKNSTWWRGVFVLAQAFGLLVFGSSLARATEQVVRFQKPEYRVSQGVGIALVMVERVGGAEGKVTVQYQTSDGSAESWTDYVGATGLLTWESGDAFPKPILIYLVRNEYHFTDRNFNVMLVSPEGAVLGEPQSTVVSIDDGFNLGCAGKLDFTFKPTEQISVPIYVNARAYLHVYPSGKVLVTGRIVGSSEQGAVMRLNNDGSVDPTFTPFRIGTGSSSSINGLAVQSDGKILVSGWFGELETGLVRLLPDGELDSAFLAAGEGANVPGLYSMALDDEQRILIGGTFNSVYGIASTNLARLLQDGKLDNSFRAELRSPATGAIQGITHIKALPGETVLVVQQESDQSHVVRLNSDGSRDATFLDKQFERISALEVQPDGRIYVGFHAYIVEPRLVRLNADGSLDESWTAPSFQAAGDRGIMDILVDGSGGVYVSGDFQGINEDYETGTRDYQIAAIAHLLSTGLVDPTFVAGVEMNVGADDVESITSMALEPGGKLMVAGDFDQIDGAVRKGVGRLYTAGDQCSGFISFDEKIVRVWENAELSLVVRRKGETNSAVTVQYEIQQSQRTYSTATEGVDFVTGSGFITFQPGERVTHLVIPLINDALIEPTESFTIILREPNNGGVLTDDDFYVQVIILDDDSQGLPGMPDPSFPPLGFMAGDLINAITVTSDSKILVGGLFQYALAYKHTNIARLNGDLSIDTTFVSNGVPFEVYDIQVQSSGKILVGGEEGLVRLNSDGSRDETFTTFLSGQYRRVHKILIQPDGKILFGGKFVVGDASPGIARLLESGELDGSFNPRGGIHDITEWPRAVYDLDLYPDGRIMVFGDFIKISDSNSYYVARLFANGSADNTFQVMPWNTVFSGMIDLENNRVLIGGDFRQIGPTIQRMGLAGLDQQGALDESFLGHVQVDNSRTVQKIVRDRNGKILVAGNFAWLNGKYPVTEFLYGNGLARFNVDGSGDETFFTGSGAEFEEVHAVAVLPDGSYMAGGTFVNFAGEPRAAMVHLFGDGGDRAGKVQFRNGQFGGIEGGEVILDVDRIWGTKGTLTVSYRTEDISARAGEDYVGQSGELTFLDGETNKTIRVPLLQDDKVELWDAFRVVLESTEPVLAYRPTADVSITEADAGIVFDSTPIQVEEGGMAKVLMYYLTRSPSQPVTLDYETISGMAFAGDDFTAKSGTITIEANASKQIEIPVLSDSVNETDENFYVVLKNPSLPININNRAEIIIKGSGPGFIGFVPSTLKRSAGGNFEAILNVRPGKEYRISQSLNLKEWTPLNSINSPTTEYLFRSSAPEEGAFYKIEEIGP